MATDKEARGSRKDGRAAILGAVGALAIFGIVLLVLGNVIPGVLCLVLAPFIFFFFGRG